MCSGRHGIEMTFLLIIFLWVSLLCDCQTAPLQIGITGRSGSTSCPGDNVTYTCTVPAITHRWRIPSLGLDENIARGSPTFSNSQFTIVTTSDEGGASLITTALTVISFPGLNQANVSCSDLNLLTTEVQEITAMVFAAGTNGCPDINQTVPLQIDIVGRQGSTSCPGDTVTYTCTVPAGAHRWRIPSLGLSESLIRGDTPFSDSQFTIAITSDGDGTNPIATALTVISFPGLDGANITCSGANIAITEVQESTAMVFAPGTNGCPDEPTLITNISGRIGSTSCVGDTVTYICTIDAVAHRWMIPSLGLNEALIRDDPPFSDSQFTIVKIADGGDVNPITTALTVISFPGLDGANITCSDPNKFTTEVQKTTAMVFGLPSAPTLTAMPGTDLTSLIVNITPPTYAPGCVQFYNLSLTLSDGSTVVERVESAADNELEAVQYTFRSLDVCSDNYSFEAVPVTAAGAGERSSTLPHPPPTLAGPVTSALNTGNRISLSWTVPITRLFNVSIRRSDVGVDSCVEHVANLSGPSSIEVPVPCGFARRRVTFCVQVTSFDCVTEVTTLQTPELPGLVVLEQLTNDQQSTTITLLVAIADGYACLHEEQLEILVQVRNESSMIVATVVPFSTQVVTLVAVPPGMHECMAYVVSGSHHLDTTTIPCQSTEPVLVEAVDSSSTLTAISASLGALCVVTLLIGVIAGCLVSRMCMARADTAPITEVELNRLPTTTTTAVPVPMYEDIDDAAFNGTTFLVMEDNKADGHKVAVELNRLPITTTTTTTAAPVPMYEDIDDVALNSTTFRNTIVMEDNEAYGHKVALQ